MLNSQNYIFLLKNKQTNKNLEPQLTLLDPPLQTRCCPSRSQPPEVHPKSKVAGGPRGSMLASAPTQLSPHAGGKDGTANTTGRQREHAAQQNTLYFIPTSKYSGCPPFQESRPNAHTGAGQGLLPVPAPPSGIIRKPKQFHSACLPTAVIFAIFVITGKCQQRPFGVPSHSEGRGLTLHLP